MELHRNTEGEWFIVTLRNHARGGFIQDVIDGPYISLCDAIDHCAEMDTHDTEGISVERLKKDWRDLRAHPASDPRPDSHTHPEYWTE